MNDNGWIKLYRQIQSHWMWQEKPFQKALAWIDLLLSANYRDKKIPINGKPVMIKGGSFHTSIAKLADKWGWDKRTVSRFLDVLESDGMLTQERSEHGTTLTIINYGFYQGDSTAEYTAQCTADSTAQCTSECTTDGTAECTAQCTQTINIKNNKEKEEDKEVKELKNYYGTFANVQLSDPEYEKLMEKFPDDFEERIDCLSEYMRSKGKTYKSHYATILNWDRMEQKRQQDNKPKTSAYMDALKNRVDVVDSWT